MGESITVNCPECQRALQVPAGSVGAQGRCPFCSHVFEIPAGEAAPAAGAGPAPSQSAAAGPAAQAPGAPQAASPYGPPTGFGQAPGGRPAQTITAGMAQHLQGTRPWVLFLAILGFIGCGLMVIGGLGMLALGGMAAGGPGAGLGAVVCFAYVLVAVVYAVGSYLLYSYASAIKRFRQSGRSGDMEAALSAQRSWWKFVGILTIIALSLYLLAVLFTLVAGTSRIWR